MASKSRKKGVSNTHNLVGSHISRLAQQFFDLAGQLDRLRIAVKQQRKLGKFADCTVYKVKAAIIHEHARRSHIAVRFRRPKQV